MKRVLSLVLTLALILTFIPGNALSVYATSVSDLKFTLNADGESYSVTGYQTYPTGTLEIPSSYNGMPVTSIGYTAFQRCKKITAVIIPNSVTEIGRYAFSECTGLTSVSLSQGVKTLREYAFAGCTSLTSITIPENISVIEEFAFNSCTALNTINFNAIACEEMGYSFGSAFAGCTNIKTINVGNGVAKIPRYAFKGCTNLSKIVLPNSVAEIGCYAFYGCSGLTSLSLGSNLTRIGDRAFYKCTGITSIQIPTGATSIGIYAFSECTSLSNIISPNTVTYIGDSAFSGTPWYTNKPDGLVYAGKVAYKYKGTCPETIVIEDGTLGIADYAFSNRSNLVNVTIPDSVVCIGYRAFQSCSGLTEITLPSNLERIGSAAFIYCTGLTSIFIPENVSIIGEARCNCSGVSISTAYGESVLGGCVGIENISVSEKNATYYSAGNCIIETATRQLIIGCKNSIIPNDVTEIASAAFSGCEGLTSIKLPDSVTTINKSAFAGCTDLKTVYLSNNIINIGDDSFYGCSQLTTVFYKGSESDQQLLTISDDGNTDLIDAEWLYNCWCNGSAEHLYDDCYDTICDVCGLTRAITHSFKWVIDQEPVGCRDGIKHEECTECHTTQNVGTVIEATGTHIFDDACDAVCNLCETTREAPHNYEWIVDQQESCGVDGIKHEECTVCHIKRNENTKIVATGNHSFTDENDIECNVCNQGYVLIQFNSNGGTNISPIRTLPNQTISLPSAIPTKTGYNFVGWSTSKNGDVSCRPSNSFRSSTSVTLYAQWNKICTGCGGDGTIIKTCTECRGSGKVTIVCTLCDGAGGWYYDTKCPYCISGLTCKVCGIVSGCTNPNQHGLALCGRCDASGYITSFDRCDVCSGKGNKGEKTCPTCNGAQIKLTCSSCNGCGEVIRTNMSAPNAPVLASVDSSTIILQAITNGEYSIDGNVWQESPIFENLEPGKVYQLYQRYAKTDTTNASASSAALTVSVHNHTYDNACDATCNVCSIVREVPPHIYDMACDTACNECGATRTVSHLYDDVCDAVCNLCEVTREAPHNYAWITDRESNCGISGIKHEECSVCHIKRNENTIIPVTGIHTFTDVNDTECNVCNEVFYQISFDSNGGTTIATIVIQPGRTTAIPTDIPTRNGYVFDGWSFTKNGDADYQPGAVMSAIDKSATLYAQWNKLCDPYAYEDCSYCSGAGEVYSHSTDCSTCGGSGLSSSACYTCTGTGKRQCSMCDGSGIDDCYWCDGTGENENKQSTCTACGGSGNESCSVGICYTCTNIMGMTVRDYDGSCQRAGHNVWVTCIQCSKCGGDGKIAEACYWCEGTGKDSCVLCNGAGKYKCSSCDGTGKRDCYTCDGTGENKVYITCDNCVGNGKIQVTCSICNGTGTVIRKSVPTPSAPVVLSYDETVIILQEISNGEYSIDGVNWQESPIFEGLIGGKEYTFYQRYAKTDTTLRSSASAGMTITTQHVYDNDCDTTCNGCGYVRTVTDHVYDNSCDLDCNICSTIREAPHVYDMVCDTTCNACGVTRTVPHLYDDESDAVCNLCGHNRAKSSGTTGDCNWYVIDTTLYVTGNGAMAPYSSTAPWGSSITKAVLQEGVTAIGKYAFYNCTKLTSITIPNSVTSIGADAFYNCSNLSSVYITDLKAWCGIYFPSYDDNPLYYADNLYLNGEEITELIIPSGTTVIKDYAFAHFSGITTVTIPDTVTSIGNRAFYSCGNLASITISDDAVTSIGSYAFYNCDKLTAVTIPGGITSIGDNAFYYCDGLTTVTIKEGVSSIGKEVFYYCTKLTSITIPNSLTYIGYSAFYGCSKLQDVWYSGSSQSNISIYSSNAPLTNATWHCNVDVVGEHIYDSVCGIFCNICGEMRTAPHMFDNICDDTCNVCGSTRTVPDHAYDSACDSTCNSCGMVRVVPDHVYDD
ncbi:MAG: leucine-rich repeat protein [Bacteroidaceae bacterium]|nr:leucine-rich repeat protein [Bacteroidaceae bacterium]